MVIGMGGGGDGSGWDGAEDAFGGCVGAGAIGELACF